MREQSISYRRIFKLLLPIIEDWIIQINPLKQQNIFKNLIKYIRELTKGKELTNSPKKAAIREATFANSGQDG